MFGSWPWWVSSLAGVGRGQKRGDGELLADIDVGVVFDGLVAERDVLGRSGHADQARDALRLAGVRAVEQDRRDAVDLAAIETGNIVDHLGGAGGDDVEHARRAG